MVTPFIYSGLPLCSSVKFYDFLHIGPEHFSVGLFLGILCVFVVVFTVNEPGGFLGLRLLQDTTLSPEMTNKMSLGLLLSD